MRTIGYPMRLGIGVLAVTSLYGELAPATGGADPGTKREHTSVAPASPAGAATTPPTLRSGYMVISGRTVTH